MPALTADKKRKILYLGTDPTHYTGQGTLIHYPVIQIVPRKSSDERVNQALSNIDKFTHLIFTSKNAVEVFFSFANEKKISLDVFQTKQFISIGSVTTRYLMRYGITPYITSCEETQEGLVKELNQLDLSKAFILLPRSSLSRPILTEFLQQKAILFCPLDLYDTIASPSLPPLDLTEIDEIIFTSPSTVRAFFLPGRQLPKHIVLTPIGPITKAALAARNR